MSKEINGLYSPNLNALIEMIKDQGSSPEELKLMGIIAIMDEALRNLVNDDNFSEIAINTYRQIEEYIMATELTDH